MTIAAPATAICTLYKVQVPGLEFLYDVTFHVTYSWQFKLLEDGEVKIANIADIDVIRVEEYDDDIDDEHRHHEIRRTDQVIRQWFEKNRWILENHLSK